MVNDIKSDETGCLICRGSDLLRYELRSVIDSQPGVWWTYLIAKIDNYHNVRKFELALHGIAPLASGGLRAALGN